MSHFNRNLSFFFILLGALTIRLYGIGWDGGGHFHPDERMLIMVTDRIQLFSQMNPDFFNYGSLPVYLLRGVSQGIDGLFNTQNSNYDGLLYIGRALSAFTDIGVIILIYNIAKLVFKRPGIAIWSAFFYAVAFFPIQNAHFFVVDVYLNFFITTLLYVLLHYHNNPSWKKIVLISVIFAAALTTKISAILFLPIILLVFTFAHTRRLHFWKALMSRIMAVFHHSHDTTVKQYISTIIVRTVFFACFTLLCTALFMPYAFIESTRFLNDIQAQMKMNSDAYIFPYTLQYVGTIPYLYYLKNIFLWGLGPVIGLLCALGFLDQTVKAYSYLKTIRITLDTRIKRIVHICHSIIDTNVFIFFVFYLIYFLFIGRSAVKFMRYMLLMYPFFVIIAAVGFHSGIIWLKNTIKSPGLAASFKLSVLFVAVFWCMAFLSIYSRQSTRIQATQWIQQYIPEGSVLAVEHWDDRVPISAGERYDYAEMTLYEQPDDEMKWTALNQKLKNTDYIVLASNRLYVPLQRLDDCKKYKFCYPRTAQYYHDLFAGKLGFQKVAEFTSYPQLSLLGQTIKVVDDRADESFTVYDHPKIIIFKKIK